MDFGKYRGKTFEEVYAEDPRYMRKAWAKRVPYDSYLLSFGKYKGRTILEVLATNRVDLDCVMKSPFSEKMTKLRGNLAKIL